MPATPPPLQRLQDFWNERYAGTACACGTAPNSFLARSLRHLTALAPAAPALQPGGLFVFEACGPEQLALGTGGPKEIALLPALAEVEADFEGAGPLTVVHRYSGLRPVIEGALHRGDGQVVQLVLRRQHR